VYTEVAKTFVLDEEMLNRLRELNPHSARSLIARLLEAEGRGFWRAETEMLQALRETFAGLEDQLEGLS
ncbi:MAG TPA: cobaltochelatase subunit CobN, partial [Pyrinomonadaceae bacterium]